MRLYDELVSKGTQTDEGGSGSDHGDRASRAGTGEAELTIDELAQRTGMTVRNIRAHQSRGLLAPPTVRGRTGYYGSEHVARIGQIRELQDDGFNLEAIKRVLDSGSSEEILSFTRAARTPFGEEEEPLIVTAEDLAEHWRGSADPALLERSIELGTIRPLDDGRFELTSPRLVRVGLELRALGFRPGHGLEIAERMREHTAAIAEIFIEVFNEAVWDPFERSGAPAEEWPRVREALERLRPLATDSVVALFHQAMNEASERAFDRRMEAVKE